MTGLGTVPGSSGSSASGTSADGSVVVGMTTGRVQQAFRWTEAGGMVTLGVLPGSIIMQSDARATSGDGTIVVGSSYSNNGLGLEAYWWSEATGMVGLGDLAGGDFASSAIAISADGNWLVGAGTTASGLEAIRWSEATGMLGLGAISGTGQSYALDVSADGSIIVGTSNDLAFIWDEVHGIRDLKEILEQEYGLDLTDWYLTSAQGVSLDGLTIVGQGVNPDGRTEGWIAVIPEPSTAALLAFGLVALGLHRRR